jgi:uncharacterized Zn-finger protein
MYGNSEDTFTELEYSPTPNTETLVVCTREVCGSYLGWNNDHPEVYLPIHQSLEADAGTVNTSKKPRQLLSTSFQIYYLLLLLPFILGPQPRSHQN